MEIKLNMKLQYSNLKMIVCVAKDNLIGSSSPQGNGLLWHSTEELKYFKNNYEKYINLW